MTVLGQFFNEDRISIFSVLGNKVSQNFIKFIVFAFAGGLVEYVGSVFQEVFLGSVSWNYDSHLLNIGGRVSLKMTFVWGVLGTIFIYLMYPHINKFFVNNNNQSLYVATFVLTVYMIINLLTTSIVLMRWRNRIKNVEPSNKIDVLIDSKYGNGKMEQRFPKIKFVE